MNLGDSQQVVIKSGVQGSGLLIITNGDNGLFLQGVKAALDSDDFLPVPP